MSLAQLKKELQKYVDKEKAQFYPTFFKTGKGQYGEGDRFIGVVVPDQRKVAKKYKDLSLPDIKKLLASPIHEHRLTALFILISQFQKGDDTTKKKLFEFYLANRKGINNWDLIDSSAHKIVGKYCRIDPSKKKILYSYAQSKNLWERRIAVIATFAFINNNEFDDAIRIDEMLVNDTHDLIHKAVGWQLREIGKKDLAVEEKFLKKYRKTMPRTMLRYAIEKFSDKKKKYYMKK